VTTIKARALHSLRGLGFSEYESKVYCALLERAPANGYEIAGTSGIPRSKVYEVLEKLIDRGAIVKAEGGGPKATAYAPTNPRALIDSLKSEFDNTCATARTAIDSFFDHDHIAEVFWRIVSTDELIRRARELAAEASETLHVALWSDEFGEVYPSIIEALNRGVRVALVLYDRHDALDPVRAAGASAILHSETKHEIEAVVGRQFVMAADHKSCLTGTILPDGTVDGAYTHNRGMVVNALDLVNHEIYVEKIYRDFRKQLEEKYGKALIHLQPFEREVETSG
jgi:sugar-specific transcriptional regulator TrmB